MSEPFLAEIRMVGFNFPPRGWATCDGQLLPINQNQALFSLLGTTYGGDGRVTFALPDLRGRTPIHFDGGGAPQHILGQKGGEETHALRTDEMPSHRHTLRASNTGGNSATPLNNVFANAGTDVYAPAQSLVQLAAGAVASVGGGQGHQNMQPFLVVNFCIALMGLFPSRN